MLWIKTFKIVHGFSQECKHHGEVLEKKLPLKDLFYHEQVLIKNYM